MRAILKREFRGYFQTFTGCVFLAFLLLFAGIYASVINLANGIASYEVTLGNMAFVYVFAIPLLTMRSFPGDRKDRTDLLLASLPQSTAGIVLGKYLAPVGVLFLGTALMAPTPLILSLWGKVNFAAAYYALFAFFLLGAALLSFGLLVSALSGTQAAAAGISFGGMLLIYFLSDLAGFLPGTALASFLALLGLAAASGGAIFWLSRSLPLALALSGAAAGGAALLYALDRSAMEGLLERGVNALSPFQRFYAVLGGEADLTLILFDLSFAALFTFYTVYAVERRRWS